MIADTSSRIQVIMKVIIFFEIELIIICYTKKMIVVCGKLHYPYCIGRKMGEIKNLSSKVLNKYLYTY